MSALRLRIECDEQIERFALTTLESIGEIGFSPINSFANCVVAYSSDGGRHELAEYTDIKSIVASHAGIQLWLSEDTDLYVAWDKSNGTIEFYFDTLPLEIVTNASKTICATVGFLGASRRLSFTISLFEPS